MRDKNILPTLGKAAVAVAAAVSFSTWATDYHEAPQLAKLVKAGELPTVEERLPEEPLVVTPIESIGQYGGQLRLVGLKTDAGHRMRMLKYDNLFNFNRHYTGIEPNLATDYAVNDDLTEYTISLRKGVKWSDGHPFTAEDIKFYIDLVGRPDWTGNRPMYARAPGDATATVVDEHTVKITLAKPDGMFIRKLANTDGSNIVQFPKHYCEQFLPEVNKNAGEQAKEAGFDSWLQFFQTKCRSIYFQESYQNPDRPSVNAWKVKVTPGPATQYAVWERNPYYWQVDTEGNQLPYLDEVYFAYSENKEEMVLRAAAGETDFQTRHIGKAQYRPMLFQNAEKGGYEYQTRPSTRMNATILGLNQTSKDPVKRELFANKDFRIALSYAIDREGISETIYSGVTDPYQAAPSPGSAFYDEKFATQYTAYNPEKANQMLDAIGLNKRDDEGYRLDKTGQRLRIQALFDQRKVGEPTDILELVKNDWKKVGIFLDIRIVEGSYLQTQRLANDYDLIPALGDGGIGVLDAFRSYAPQNPESTWGLGYYYWMSDKNHADAVEPPAHVKKQIELYRKMGNTASTEEQTKLMSEIVKIAKENFYVIGTVSSLDEGVVIKHGVHNADTEVPSSYGIASPGPMRTSQLWKEAK
ncbi:peptide ABC transporter substrate-binding protein [Vibrio albus]|uniref:Peptide ABC transporter substrate-binding protein n=1 Tax=Vibrio albus TaxID=2200953 RepID=A0A2U3B5H9_9VIBR|nr:ABC transporter substrate-binding protein [Vibrio albus]PWI32050.1 peptide ABC transporter substrate-binding protein [Vibrio albus]